MQQKINVNYKKLLEDFIQEIKKDDRFKKIDKQISLDVSRTYVRDDCCVDQNVIYFGPIYYIYLLKLKVLHNLLKAYAFYDEQILYYQGMNYIMAFLNINIKDEETTFKCFCQIMNKHNRQIFEKDFFKINSYFYKLAKLMELFTPKIIAHFEVNYNY